MTFFIAIVRIIVLIEERERESKTFGTTRRLYYCTTCEPCRNNSINSKLVSCFFQTCILFILFFQTCIFFHSIPRISLLSYIFFFACLSFIICIVCVFFVSILYAYVFFASQMYNKYNNRLHKVHIKTFQIIKFDIFFDWRKERIFVLTGGQWRQVGHLLTFF